MKLKKIETSVKKLAALKSQIEKLEKEADKHKDLLKKEIEEGTSIVIGNYRVAHYKRTTYSFSKDGLIKVFGDKVLKYASKYESASIQLKKVGEK